MDPIANAQAYINRISVSPDDGGIQDLITEQLKPFGFTAIDLSRGNTRNRVLIKGTGAPFIALAGHTDVVPAGDLHHWKTPPFAATIHQDMLIGRGAVDMKGALAAMVSALAQTSPHQGTIALLLTSDEEGEATDGSRAICDWMLEQNLRADCILIGEPTCSEQFGDALKNGRRGSSHANVTIHARSAHVAYTPSQHNPVHQACELITQLATQANLLPRTHFHATAIQASSAVNVVPSSVEFRLNWRHPASVASQDIEHSLEEMIKERGINATVAFSNACEPYQSPIKNATRALQQAITQACQIRPAINQLGGASDGRFFQHVSDEVIEFGLINQTIHQPNERTAVADIVQLAKVYRRWLELLTSPQELAAPQSHTSLSSR